MKKLLFLFATSLIVLVSSCGQNAVKEINEKIQNGKDLTQDDYTVIIQYLDEALFANPLMNGQELGDDIEETIKINDEWKKKYGYVDIFSKVIMSVDPSEFNDKNKELLDKLNTKIAGDFSPINANEEIDENEEIESNVGAIELDYTYTDSTEFVEYY